VKEALEDPQVQALGSVAEMVHPQMGKVMSIHCPVLADGVRPLQEMHAPPMIGEHTDEILSSLK
jgi:formyl-CoA transferase